MKNIRMWFIVLLLSFLSVADSMFAQTEKPLMQFGLFADAQFADADANGSRFYKNSLKKLNDCVDYFNAQRVQFTINLGDIIDRNSAELDSVLTCLRRLDSKTCSTTGNHDYKGVTENNALYEKLRMPSEYYSFKKKGWLFIVLNTNEVAPYSNIMGTAKELELSALTNQIKASGGIQGATWNGGVSVAQLQWLNRILAKCEKAGDNALVFSHHPLYPQTEYTALNNMEILSVIEKYSCVKAIFSGHHHSGSFAYYKNLPVVTVEGMVETEAENAFGIVKIYKNKLILEGKGRMTSRVFNF